MMRSRNIFLIILILSAILLACSKSDNPPNTNSNFTWTYLGSTYVATQDTAYTTNVGPGPKVVAGTGTSFLSFTRRFYFNLTSFNVGSYSLTPFPSPNHFEYIDDMGFNHAGMSGTFNITFNANNRMSGNFSGTMQGPAGTNPVSGSFSNMVIKP